MRVWILPLEHVPISSFHPLRRVQGHLLISQELHFPLKEHDEEFLQEERENDPNQLVTRSLTQMKAIFHRQRWARI